MKNIIITGSSGMIGALVLKKCLDSDDVNKVTSIVRKASGISHPKLNEINLTYKIMKALYKPISAVYPNIGITSEQLASAMIKVGWEGYRKPILENKNIRNVVGLS